MFERFVCPECGRSMPVYYSDWLKIKTYWCPCGYRRVEVLEEKREVYVYPSCFNRIIIDGEYFTEDYKSWLWDQYNLEGCYEALEVIREIKMACRNCGKPVRRPYRFYCSSKCQSEFEDWHWENCTWEGLRAKIIRDNDYKCAKCGKDIRWDGEVHHITPISMGGQPLDPNNLVPLCKDCHKREHRKLYKVKNTGN
ncbi:hypothetical protein DRP04_12795 [Archaeoglobales archaeon]|nr:MAG: hypothetical protein DRP04_12795 [Archaeoglobales archaeon]